MSRKKLLLFFMIFCSCSVWQDRRVVAVVNGQKIRVSTVRESLFEKNYSFPTKLTSGDYRLRHHVIQELILDTLIEQEAKKANIVIENKDVEKEFSNLFVSYPKEAITQLVRSKSLVYQGIKKRIYKDLVKKKTFASLGNEVPAFLDSELRIYYEEHQTEFPDVGLDPKENSWEVHKDEIITFLQKQQTEKNIHAWKMQAMRRARIEIDYALLFRFI